MNEELKTLKELQLCTWDINDKDAKKCLRIEAIKWVKAIRQTKLTGWTNTSYAFESFFNLTEEDLKEQEK